MGRSVSYANDSLLIAYAEWWQPEPETDELYAQTEPDPDEFSWYLDYVQETACEMWPSFNPCDEWLGREDHAIAENALGYIGVSEYCGVASVWFAPKPNSWEYSNTHHREQLAAGFARAIARKFYATFSTLDRLGGVSDGTSVFMRREAA